MQFLQSSHRPSENTLKSEGWRACAKCSQMVPKTGVANDKEKGRGVEGPEAAVIS